MYIQKQMFITAQTALEIRHIRNLWLAFSSVTAQIKHFPWEIVVYHGDVPYKWYLCRESLFLLHHHVMESTLLFSCYLFPCLSCVIHMYIHLDWHYTLSPLEGSKFSKKQGPLWTLLDGLDSNSRISLEELLECEIEI